MAVSLASKNAVRRWGAGTAAIVRTLVAATEPLTGVALAKAAGVTQPRASQVIRQLTDQAAVRATEDGYVGRPAKLLDLYGRRAQPALVQAESYWYSTRPLPDQAARVIRLARATKTDVAFSADLGPDLLVPWRHPTLAIVYSSKSLELSDAGFVPAEGRADAGVIVRWTTDWTLLAPVPPWPRFVDDIPLTDPTQQWWDLLDLGGEDRRETADRLRRAIVTRSPSLQTLESIVSIDSETVVGTAKPSRQHDRSVSKTIEIHRIVLERFLDDPDRVLKFGRTRLHVLGRSLSKRSSPYVETWQRLLDGPRSDIVRLLLSTDEDDVELLKMSPFTTLLSDSEREEVTRRSRLRRAGTR